MAKSKKKKKKKKKKKAAKLSPERKAILDIWAGTLSLLSMGKTVPQIELIYERVLNSAIETIEKSTPE